MDRQRTPSQRSARRQGASRRNATPSLDHYLDRIPRIDGCGQRAARDRAAATKPDQASAAANDSDQLLLDNLGLVVGIARRYWFDGIALDDLIQAGNLGLLRAAASYDPERTTDLRTWLAFGIRQAIIAHLASAQHAVALPRNVHLRLVQGRSVTGEALAGPRRLLAVPLERQVVGDDPDRVVGLLPPQADEAPASAEQAAMCEEMASLLDVLDDPARRLIVERFGLDGQSPKGVMAQAEAEGVSREAIRLRYNAAMAKLGVEARARCMEQWLNSA